MQHEAVSGLELITRGGFMMYPLLISALLALTVIFERYYVLLVRLTTPSESVTKTLEQARSGDVGSALKTCEGNSPLLSVLSAGLKHFDQPIEEMELAMKNQAESWVPKLEKRIDFIDTVITAAPLMGLLGTITGMMASFRVLSQKGVNEPNAITGGVAEALIATATGLVIALICLVAYNYLTARVKHFIYELESVASQLVEARFVSLRSRKGRDSQ